MDLVLLVCLVASPGDCRPERLLYSYEAAAPQACMLAALPIVAEWRETHPEWSIARWRCEPLERRARR
jgi:hypothetical protein